VLLSMGVWCLSSLAGSRQISAAGALAFGCLAAGRQRPRASACAADFSLNASPLVHCAHQLTRSMNKCVASFLALFVSHLAENNFRVLAWFLGIDEPCEREWRVVRDETQARCGARHARI